MSGLLGIPLGGAGSGRRRYGVAMAMYAEGQISAALLEGYRVAASNDKDTPGAVLAERGLPLPDFPAPCPEALLRTLVSEADSYLATLPGPGVAEVRQGIAQGRHGAAKVAPELPNAVVDAHLAEALASLAPSHASLAAAIAAARPYLNWITYDSYPRAHIGESFAAGHAFASIIGEDSAFAAKDFDLGLFLIAPHVLYRDHHHAAPELYAPLTGPHGWRFGPGTPLQIKPAHQPVWNPPHRPHLTKVGPVPFLCLFGWTQNVMIPAEVIPAEDWPGLEALRLGL